MYTLFPFLVSCLLSSTFITWAAAEQETILKEPHQVQSTWIWSWTSQWRKQDDNEPGKVPYYTACDASSQQDKWLRSNVFLVGNASRIDVTVQYAVIDCSSFSLPNCKLNLKLFIYKTNIKHPIGGSNAAPEPSDNPEMYKLFNTTSPTNLTIGSLSKDKLNTETYSFLTNSSTPYHYLAIKYEGGCFALYSVTINYSVCPSLALPSGLIQLPRTMAPASGSIRVSGSCAANAQPLANNITLYGECNANGEWNSNATGGSCLCTTGYGKYLNESGGFCNECPSGTYQDKASNKACKPCPLNSVQDVTRTKCNCAPSFYRIKNESIYDNCTGPPSEPRFVKSTFSNASVVTIEWTTPLDLGGRSDVYYQVECNKCNKEGKDCNMNCTGAVITHTPRTSRKATVQRLSTFTYYQFKVFSKNGVSHLAEMNGNKSKFAVGLVRTGEGKPGSLVNLTVEVLNSTAVRITWGLPTPNGEVTFEVLYYSVDDSSSNVTLYTNHTSLIIVGLENGRKYVFQVRARTSVGFGEASYINQTVPTMTSVSPRTNPKSSLSAETIIAIFVPLAILLICIIILFVVWRRRRKKKEKASNVLPMSSERMFVDPSNYNSPLEALRNHTHEIDSNNLELKINIGEGEFADVYKAVLVTENKREVVAVKVLKPTSSTKTKKNFILEASIMGQFKHPNVMELKGVVTRSPDKPMMIVTEYMENGSLEHFLKSRNGMLTSLQLVGMARGVADGMSYLSRINFIHRDLAARNVLVAENLSSKISDFGLSRELEENSSIYMTQGGKIPIRWTAPEAIRYRKFSSASDVWSFGILLWEIMAFAERPYWDWDNEEVFQRVEKGFRLPPPMDCPKMIHNIMLDCWEEDMNNRPKFPDIVKRLEELIRSPDKMNEQALRFQISNGAHVNFGMLTSVEEWLTEINLGQYTDNFTQNGITELDQLMQIDDEGLQILGVTLIGHRNKIKKSINELKKQRNRQSYREDFEISI